MPRFWQMLDILSPAFYALCAVHKNLHSHSCCSRGNYSLDRDSFLLRWDAVLLGVYFLTVQRMIMAPLSTAWLWKVEVLWSFQPKTQQCSPQEMHLQQCHCSSSNLTPFGCFPSDIQILDTSMCNNFLYVTYAASYQMSALPAPMMCAIILPASVLHFTNHSNNSVLMHASAPAIATLSNVLIW